MRTLSEHVAGYRVEHPHLRPGPTQPRSSASWDSCFLQKDWGREGGSTGSAPGPALGGAFRTDGACSSQPCRQSCALKHAKRENVLGCRSTQRGSVIEAFAGVFSARTNEGAGENLQLSEQPEDVLGRSRDAVLSGSSLIGALAVTAEVNLLRQLRFGGR